MVIGKIISTASRSGNTAVNKTRLTHRLLIKGKEMSSNQMLFLILNHWLLHAEIVSISFLWLPEKYIVLKSPHHQRTKGVVTESSHHEQGSQPKPPTGHALPNLLITTLCILTRPNLARPFL